MFFKYGETEIEYLKGRDARMRDLIEKRRLGFSEKWSLSFLPQ